VPRLSRTRAPSTWIPILPALAMLTRRKRSSCPRRVLFVREKAAYEASGRYHALLA
jgi:hypothetical protein